MVFIVAEIGINWDGDHNLLKGMMKEADRIGCDAVKFQAFQKDLIKNHPEKSRLIESSISQDNVEKINGIAKEIGIEWFCTPMYPEAIDFLDPFVKRYKIREFDGRKIVDNQSSEIFKKLLHTGKEIIISTEKSPRNCNNYKNPKIKWLYCIPKYPSNPPDHDFSNLGDFDGFSNHCQQMAIPLMSTILGSEILEIHITADKSKNFIDNNVSFDYGELEKLVKNIRICERIRH